MKRSQEVSAFAADSSQAMSFPAQKRFKAAARVSVGTSVMDGESSSNVVGEESWTKVEKRKAKKMKKTEAKLDVRIHQSLCMCAGRL